MKRCADSEYHSPLFLDCCGLLRRVLRDLRHDFGFRVGPWNQSYLFDTLPVTIEHEEDMKPGDLVFVSATYHNTKSMFFAVRRNKSVVDAMAVLSVHPSVILSVCCIMPYNVLIAISFYSNVISLKLAYQHDFSYCRTNYNHSD